MQALLIGEEQKQELALIKQNAESNPFSAAVMKQRIEGNYEPGNEVLYTCYIPIDYKVVFTIETALDAADKGISHGMYRHLSVSIKGENKMPHPAMVQELMKELGFVNTIESGKLYVWSERKNVVNIVEFIL